MKRRRIIRRGDLRLVAAVLATLAFAVLLNQPSRSANSPTWLDSNVLRLNLPADVAVSDDSSLARPKMGIRSASNVNVAFAK